MPIWGVCRGHQLFAVLEGGHLIQRVEGHQVDQSNGEEASFITKKSNLYSFVFGEKNQLAKIPTHSDHYQAVDAEKLPSTLRIVAKSDDGTVKCIESKKRKNIFTTQFHPESMPDDKLNQKFLLYYLK